MAAASELTATAVVTAEGVPTEFISGVKLTASSSGLSVRSPSGAEVCVWEWDNLERLGAGTTAADPADADAPHQRVVELRVSGRPHILWANDADVSGFLLGCAGFAPTSVVLPRAVARRRHGPGTEFTLPFGLSFTVPFSLGRPFSWGRSFSFPWPIPFPFGRRRGGRDGQEPRWALNALATGAAALALVAGLVTVAVAATGGAVPAKHPHSALKAAASTGAGGGSIMAEMEHQYASSAAMQLAAASAPPAPAPPAVAASPVLGTHQIFGFAPYWTLPDSAGFDVADFTTLAYFSLDVNPDGSINESGAGWVGYQSQDLATLVTRAHAAGDRVVLTVTCFDQTTLNELTSDPSAATTLSASLVALVQAKNLDGVNFDFEGQGSADQAGLTSLMAQVSAVLRGADSHWQLTMDTYGSSAGDSSGFYNIAALAPSVDAFFVMAYDMNAPSTPSPTSPLTGTGFTDQDAVEQYASVVPASKVILGIPYYGYSWPTSGPALGDPATGMPTPTPVPYSQVASSNWPVYWDATSDTAWTSYQVGTQWYQTFFDDPTSVALKSELASSAHLAGVGVWALGMDGNSSAMLDAVVGTGHVVKDYKAGPVASSTTATTTTTSTTSTTTTTTTPTTTTTTGPTSSYSGTWNAAPEVLEAVQNPPTGGTADGTLVGFTSNNPSDACLSDSGAPALSVTALPGTPAGTYLVTATTPTDCVAGSWEFVDTSGSSSSEVTGDTGSGGG